MEKKTIRLLEKKSNEIIWKKKMECVLQQDDEKSWTWFPDGEMNTCYNCLAFILITVTVIKLHLFMIAR